MADFFQLHIPDTEYSGDGASGQLLGLGIGAGQIAAFPEIFDKKIRFAVGAPQVAPFDDDNGPGCDRKKKQQQQDKLNHETCIAKDLDDIKLGICHSALLLTWFGLQGCMPWCVT